MSLFVDGTNTSTKTINDLIYDLKGKYYATSSFPNYKFKIYDNFSKNFIYVARNIKSINVNLNTSSQNKIVEGYEYYGIIERLTYGSTLTGYEYLFLYVSN